jgi:hypothetical protein
MLNGDIPVLLVGVSRFESLADAEMPAKKIMPQYMKITLNATCLIA